MVIKQGLWLILAVFMTAMANGQQNDRDTTRRQRVGINRDNWIAKRVTSKEFLEKVGIQGDQATKLKASMESIDKQSAKLSEDIKQAAIKQAEIAKKVLAEPGANVDEIMKIIEQIGKWRTEQAKLATQRLVVIRDNLTAEQRAKASAILMEEQKKGRETKERTAQPNRPAAPKGW
jgi:hypothetical protein